MTHSPDGASAGGLDEFERYPALASWMERLGNTPGLMSLGDWMVFCGAVNSALKQARALSPSPGLGGSAGADQGSQP